MPVSDVVVVGGGVAGLVAAWQASRRGLSVTLLESERSVGGRMRQIDYPSRGSLVAGGAGIGRKRRDRRLRRLLEALRVPFGTFRHRVYYGGGSRRGVRAFLASASAQLRRAALAIKREERRAVAAARRRPPGQNAIPRVRPRPTFAALLRSTLGTAQARRWRELMGFGDDARADGVETALQYNFRDNFGLGIGLRVPWNLLAQRLVSAIRRAGGKVVVGARVERLGRGGGAGGGAPSLRAPSPLRGSELRLSQSSSDVAAAAAAGVAVVAGRGSLAGRTYRARRRLILALPASAASRLLRGHLARAFPAESVLPRPQPFLLAYDTAADAVSRAALSRAVPRYRVLPGSPLQKILPVNRARGVYMVAYADGERAVRLARRIGVDPLSAAPLAPPSRCLPLRTEVRRALRLPSLRFVGEAAAGRRRPEGRPEGRREGRAACLVRFLPEGTHYHPPLDRARFTNRAAALASLSAALPARWFWVGEAVAKHDQGWVEGALESVERELRWGSV